MTATATRLHLYELADEQRALDELVAMDDGEWTETHEALAQELTAKLVEKADGFCGYIRTVEAVCAAMKTEEERLAARRKAREARLAQLRGYAMMQLERMGRDRIEGTLFTLARQRGKAQVVVHVTPDKLPPAYVRVIPESRLPDKAALYTALSGGAAVDGVELVPTYTLRIR